MYSPHARELREAQTAPSSESMGALLQDVSTRTGADRPAGRVWADAFRASRLLHNLSYMYTTPAEEAVRIQVRLSRATIAVRAHATARSM